MDTHTQPSTPRGGLLTLPPPVYPAWTDPVGRLSPTSPPFQVHEVLRPSSIPTRAFHYDIAKPPLSLIFLNLMSYTLSTLDEPATIPVLQRLSIKTPTTRHLTVSIFNPRGITVLDVLTALYDAFHAPAVRYLSDDIRLPSALRRPGRDKPRSRSTDVLGSWATWTSGSSNELESQRQIYQLSCRTTFAGLECQNCDDDTGIWVFRLFTEPAGSPTREL